MSCSFYLYSFCKYVYYGFPIIINLCNPGVHYETPCAYLTTLALDRSVLQREITKIIVNNFLWSCKNIDPK